MQVKRLLYHFGLMALTSQKIIVNEAISTLTATRSRLFLSLSSFHTFPHSNSQPQHLTMPQTSSPRRRVRPSSLLLEGLEENSTAVVVF